MSTGESKQIPLHLTGEEIDDLITALNTHCTHLHKIYAVKHGRVSSEWKSRAAKLRALQRKLVHHAQNSRKGE